MIRLNETQAFVDKNFYAEKILLGAIKVSGSEQPWKWFINSSSRVSFEMDRFVIMDKSEKRLFAYTQYGTWHAIQSVDNVSEVFICQIQGDGT